jgi:hypothetical protein
MTQALYAHMNNKRKMKKKKNNSKKKKKKKEFTKSLPFRGLPAGILTLLHWPSFEISVEASITP